MALVHSQSCAAITIINSRTFSLPQKSKLLPPNGHSLATPTPKPGQPLIHFLDLRICLLWAFHRREILQYMAFYYDYYYSRFIYFRERGGVEGESPKLTAR